MEAERQKLMEGERVDLAARVMVVSVEDASCGYDILSFDTNGGELHIEVKATQRLEASDPGFWLSANELHTAQMDPCWRLYRVWSVDASPCFKDLGNVVSLVPGGWTLKPSQYFFGRA